MVTGIVSSNERAWLQKPISIIAIAVIHICTLVVSVAYAYLAWDGGRVMQQAAQAQGGQAFSTEVYRAVYEHYFSGVTEPGWTPLSLFIGVSNVLGLYVWAPLLMMMTAVLLGNRLNEKWRWLIVGASLIVIGLLLWLMPTLSGLVTILD